MQSELAIKEKKLSTQTENMERGLAERDIVISQQAELLNKLQEDLVEVGSRTMTAARAEIETHFQRHMVGPAQSRLSVFLMGDKGGQRVGVRHLGAKP